MFEKQTTTIIFPPVGGNTKGGRFMVKVYHPNKVDKEMIHLHVFY